MIWRWVRRCSQLWLIPQYRVPTSGKFIRAGPGKCTPTNLPDPILHGIPQGRNHFHFRGINEFFRHLRSSSGMRSAGSGSGLLLDGFRLPPPLSGKRIRFVHPQPLRWSSLMFDRQFAPIFTRTRGENTVQLNAIAKLDKTASSGWSSRKQDEN